MNIENILQTGETQSIEFKKSLSLMKEVCATLCAMLNTKIGTGMVLFGISPENEVVGIDGNLDSMQKTLVQHIRQKFDPSIICFDKINDSEICVIDILRWNKPLYLETIDRNGQKSKKFYIRSGNTSQELGLDEIGGYLKSRF